MTKSWNSSRDDVSVERFGVGCGNTGLAGTRPELGGLHHRCCRDGQVAGRRFQRIEARDGPAQVQVQQLAAKLLIRNFRDVEGHILLQERLHPLLALARLGFFRGMCDESQHTRVKNDVTHSSPEQLSVRRSIAI
ncbi:MAG: hypothetical protein HYY76_20770 [Acidobacteria bacterium]|nr:hypothetical protein [Acidobacteriota bacterium]